ncbi:sensor histidine kinase [Nocardioides pantholopis]|uniref:sensor histidine kinase n=1 Tax=Nocardioides pantholopis TaxID=2483798 RepID=UPI000FD9F776|nr:sensor histidine kinase [Nocardioides pantholopis]
MSATVPGEQAWERSYRHLPLALLVVATVAALATGPATDGTSPAWRLAAQLALVAATAACLAWWAYGRPLPTAAASTPFRYVLRTLLAFALTLLNPLFCVFGWIGFADATDTFRGRGVWLAFGATAVVMATGQSGGLPVGSTGHVVLFLALFALNFGLAAAMGRYAIHVERTSEDRASAITELERVNASLEEAIARNDSLQQTVVAQARVAGVQEERQRLSREIHDTIAQSLAAVLAQLQAAAQDPDPRPRIARATELARAALAEARRSVMDLAPVPLTEAALPEALDGIVRGWAADHAARTDLVVTGDVRPLHPEVEATVLRVTQEALANVARHSGAARVGVTLSYDGEEVVLDVRDDGVGFDPEQPAGGSSFGLRGMRARAERLAGTLGVESRPGTGTAVSVRLPALAREAA